MILDSDTNIVYFSKQLLEYTHGIDIVKQLDEHGVFVDFIPSTKDIWARDYMPMQNVMEACVIIRLLALNVALYLEPSIKRVPVY